MIFLAAVALCLVASSVHVVLWERRRRVRLGCAALGQVLRQVAVLRHRELERQAESAVMLDMRNGRMREVVAEHSWLPAAAAVVPTQRRADEHQAVSPYANLANPPHGRRLGSAADHVLVGAGVGAAGLADWWHTDEDVLQAVEALTHHDIDGTVDLWNAVQERAWDLGDGLFTMLRGHVGEQMAAGHLTGAGLEVEFPEASNEAGWDLAIEGHQANVKVTADAQGTLSEHFHKYPNIPVLLNADATNIPVDTIYFNSADGLDPSLLVGDNITLVDEALSLHDAASAVHDAFGAKGLTDDLVPGVGMLIVAVRSSVREGKLAAGGKTDRSRAMKNVAVDTSLKGGGALAGAAAGAQAGLAFDAMTGGLSMGLGTVIGGLFGAVTGGMAGSAVAAEVKLAPLKDAETATKTALETYNDRLAVEHAALVETVRAAQDAAAADIDRRGRVAKADISALLADSRKNLEAARAFDAEAVLTSAMADLTARCDTEDASLVRAGTDLPEGYLRRALRRRLNLLSRAAQRQAGAAGDGGSESEQFWDIVAASVEGDAALRAYVRRRLAVQRAEHARAVEYAALQSLGLRDQTAAARATVSAAGEQARRAGEIALKPHVTALQRRHSNYRKELSAAGLGD